jgi:hypothetical protein
LICLKLRNVAPAASRAMVESDPNISVSLVLMFKLKKFIVVSVTLISKENV